MILFVFLDGVGLGPASEYNPLAANDLPAFTRLAGGHSWTDDGIASDSPTHIVRAIDATLGMDGLPQSGTGQAALFTGVNAPKLAGRHFGPYPHSKTKALLDSDNLFHHFQRRLGVSPDALAFANAYPPIFFTHAASRDRWTVTTRCCRGAGIRLRTPEDVAHDGALTADLTGDLWRARLDLSPPRRTPAEAGHVLSRLARRHTFTLFEYFLTDKAGHSQQMETAHRVLCDLNGFFEGILAEFDASRDLLLITSDHGNLEDMSTKSHTRYPVPLIAYGRAALTFASAQDLTDVAPCILETARRMADDDLDTRE